jgi:hypothetical protein
MSNPIFSSNSLPSQIRNLAADRANIAKLKGLDLTVDTLEAAEITTNTLITTTLTALDLTAGTGTFTNLTVLNTLNANNAVLTNLTVLSTLVALAPIIGGDLTVNNLTVLTSLDLPPDSIDRAWIDPNLIVSDNPDNLPVFRDGTGQWHLDFFIGPTTDTGSNLVNTTGTGEKQIKRLLEGENILLDASATQVEIATKTFVAGTGMTITTDATSITFDADITPVTNATNPGVLPPYLTLNTMFDTGTEYRMKQVIDSQSIFWIGNATGLKPVVGDQSQTFQSILLSAGVKSPGTTFPNYGSQLETRFPPAGVFRGFFPGGVDFVGGFVNANFPQWTPVNPYDALLGPNRLVRYVQGITVDNTKTFVPFINVPLGHYCMYSGFITAMRIRNDLPPIAPAQIGGRSWKIDVGAVMNITPVSPPFIPEIQGSITGFTLSDYYAFLGIWLGLLPIIGPVLGAVASTIALTLVLTGNDVYLWATEAPAFTKTNLFGSGWGGDLELEGVGAMLQTDGSVNFGILVKGKTDYNISWQFSFDATLAPFGGYGTYPFP